MENKLIVKDGEVSINKETLNKLCDEINDAYCNGCQGEDLSYKTMEFLGIKY